MAESEEAKKAEEKKDERISDDTLKGHRPQECHEYKEERDRARPHCILHGPVGEPDFICGLHGRIINRIGRISSKSFESFFDIVLSFRRYLQAFISTTQFSPKKHNATQLPQHPIDYRINLLFSSLVADTVSEVSAGATWFVNADGVVCDSSFLGQLLR